MAELPKPLPPQERTVGQLVGETIRAYGDNFWRALPLGLPLALVDEASVHRSLGALAQISPLLRRGAADRGRLRLGLLDRRPCPLLARCVRAGAARLPALPAATSALHPPGRRLVRPRRARGAGVHARAADHGRAAGTDARRASTRSRAWARRLRPRARIAGGARGRGRGGGGSRCPRSCTRWAMPTRASRSRWPTSCLSPLLYLGGAMLYGDQAARAGGRVDVLPGRPSVRAARAAPGAPEVQPAA